jgi:leucyl-tRNA synthetase
MVTNTYIDKATGKPAVDENGRPKYAKMSKSLGNGVDPIEMIDRYGADTARLFILFAAPAEKELEWSERGIEGCHRFLNRVWRLVTANTAACAAASPDAPAGGWTDKTERDLNREIHRAIQRVGVEIGERHHFNTAIAAVMELQNALQGYANSGRAVPSLLGFGLRTMLLLLFPFAPHIASELWERSGFSGEIEAQRFPAYDPAALVLAEVEIVLQVNGKIRSRLVVAADAAEADIQAAALADAKVQEYLGGRQPKKVIVVAGKLVNIVG